VATCKVAAIAFSAQPSACIIWVPQISQNAELGSKEGTEPFVRNLFRRGLTPAKHSDAREGSSLGAVATVVRGAVRGPDPVSLTSAARLVRFPEP
jgi:hypothetical protein